jgi:peroxiredoxin
MKTIMTICLLAVVLTACSPDASGDPSAEPSGDPSGDPSLVQSIGDNELKAALQSVGVIPDIEISPLMDATITLVNGTSTKLSNYRGKPLIVGFGKTTCPRSSSDFTNLNILWNAYKDAGLEVLCAVSTDSNASSSYISEKGLTMPFFTGDYWNNLILCYGGPKGFMTPLYFIIDSNGDCIRKYENMINWLRVKNYLDNH